MSTLDKTVPISTASPPTAGSWPPPRSAEVEAFVGELAGLDPRRVSVETVQRTASGRPIQAVTLTDPDVDAALKQHVLIAAGQHGNEESARLVAVELCRELLTEPRRELLRRQKIVVMPNVNPDGAEDDSYATPEGVKPNLDHGPTGPTTPEAKALQQVAASLMPDVYIDMHARGHAGCSYDMVLYPQTKTYTEDDNLFHQIAGEMAEAGERAGLPHITHPLTWWTPPPGDDASSTLWAYRTFKSIVMLTESAEDNDHAHPQALTARVGVARVLALLERGNTRHPKLHYDGYPNDPVLGMFSVAIVSVGDTAERRRRSRVEIWQNHADFHAVRPELPEASDYKKITVDYAGPTLTRGVGVLVRVAGRRGVAAVRWNGRRLDPSQTDGFYSYHDGVSTFVVAAIKSLDAGTWELEVELDMNRGG